MFHTLPLPYACASLPKRFAIASAGSTGAACRITRSLVTSGDEPSFQKEAHSSTKVMPGFSASDRSLARSGAYRPIKSRAATVSRE